MPGTLIKETFDSAEEMLKRYWIPCVHFHPTERTLTPQPLVYEIVRSITRDSIVCWPYVKLASVDARILLYFLLYLNHTALGMEDEANADTMYIHWFIEKDQYLRHKDVALNILGWIYKEQGRVDKAIQCFNSSLVFQTERNAAIFHMLDILDALMKVLNSGVSLTVLDID